MLDVVPKVCEKPHSIIELNIKGLVVDGGPVSGDYLGAALATVFALDSLDLIVIHYVNAVDVILVKLEFMLLVN